MRFTKDQRYASPYGVVRVLVPEPNGLYSSFVIVDVSAEAHRMGWRNGAPFGAHVDDNTSPPVREWQLLGTTYTERGIDRSK